MSENAVGCAEAYGRRSVRVNQDNTGNAASNLQLSKNRAQAVSDQMKLTPVLVTGFGQELPVADNSPENGREESPSGSMAAEIVFRP